MTEVGALAVVLSDFFAYFLFVELTVHYKTGPTRTGCA